MLERGVSNQESRYGDGSNFFLFPKLVIDLHGIVIRLRLLCNQIFLRGRGLLQCRLEDRRRHDELLGCLKFLFLSKRVSQ